MKKTKKTLCIMLTFLLLVSGGLTQLFSPEAFTFLAPTVQAAENSGNCGANGNNLTWEYNPETHELKILGSGAMADYLYNVPWDNFKASVKTVTLPVGLTHIGNRAFYGFESLTALTMPDTVKTVGEWSFSFCKKLKTVKLSEGLETINAQGFSSCIAIDSIKLPGSLKQLGKSAFGDCSHLVGFSVGEGSTTFSAVDGVLFNNEKTLLIQYPSGKNGSSYTVPSTVTHIGDSAFRLCGNLTSIQLPAGLKGISGYAFSLCTKLASISIPQGVTEIGGSAFAYCSGLKSIGIPDSVTSIGEKAFADCSNLTSLKLPKGLKIINDGIIGRCAALTELTIPGGVTAIEGNLGYCASLTSIIVSEDNEHFTFADGFLLNSDKTEMFFCEDKEEIIIPATVKKVNDRFFEYYQKLTKIEIPFGAVGIGEKAFHSCKNLTEIKMYNSVKSIGSDAFYDCSALEKVYFVGTEAQWDAIEIGGYNNPLTSAERFFIEPPVVDIEIKESPLVKVINSDVIAVAQKLPYTELVALLTPGVEISQAQGEGVLYTGMTVVLKDSEGKELDRLTVAVMGDLDGNGIVAAADARLALRQSVGLEALDEIYIIAAMVGGATKVAAAQARLILRASVGLETLQSLL